MSVLKSFIFATLLLQLLACGAPPGESAALDLKNTKPEKIVLEAYRLIDSDRSTEAVEMLEEALDYHPANTKLSDTLASAYVSAAGLSVVSILPALRKALELNEVESVGNVSEGALSSLDQHLQGFARVNAKISKSLDFFLAIPKVDERGVVLLREATRVYGRVEDQLEKKHLVYRAMINAILLRSELEIGIQEGLSLNEANECSLDLPQFVETLGRSQEIFTDLFVDMAAIEPGQSGAWEDRLNAVTDALGGLTVTSGTAIVVDEVAIGFTSKQIFGPVMGEFLRCPVDLEETEQE